MKRQVMLLAAVGCLIRCAHGGPATTAPEHRAEASLSEERAATEQKAYDPNATAATTLPASTDDGRLVMRLYNPTEGHLLEADHQMKLAFDHLELAHRLESEENQMCSGVSAAERAACPLLAPYVQSVEEVSTGIRLHLKASAPASRLGSQMRCHLAFAQANGFDRAPCPLYLAGVRIELIHDQQIAIVAANPTVVRALQIEARRMFGEPLAMR